MQLILKPISQPGLDEIIVNDTLFAIGRHEEPFVGYDPRLVTRLSRRHARIFEQDGVVYLADLGSLNGTTVNGRAVDKIPVKLQPGAEVCFAGLCYQIEILGAAAKQVSQRSGAVPVMLVLKPEHPECALEPVVVSQFPFLVNKKSEVFARYASGCPIRSSISRVVTRISSCVMTDCTSRIWEAPTAPTSPAPASRNMHTRLSTAMSSPWAASVSCIVLNWYTRIPKRRLRDSTRLMWQPR